jgi:hypothetical protein
MKVGDRVLIIAPHPWAGESGTIVAEFTAHPDLEWEVKLHLPGIGEQRVAASSADLKLQGA